VTYDGGSGPRAGALEGDAVVDVFAALGEEPPVGVSGVRALLAAGRLDEAARAVAAADAPRTPLGAARLGPPVPDPDKLIGIGLNYRSHAEEAGLEPPATPTFFAKFRNALVGAGATVALPAASAKVDYEAEVAFVVGRRAREVSESEALDHIAGYTLLNDLSARDLQMATPQWMPGKVFDGSAPCGPALVTPDEAGSSGALEIELTRNGETMQRATTADLIHPIPSLLSHLSGLMTLEPGDVVFTGTPAGVGSLRRPRVWLAPGDELAVLSPQLGRLETRLG
jgi:2-keto-4-pentenoate hydratase/2-oxohepta-3-ene-1,7-dioic acid hydratase in catechol pathway